MDVELVSLEDLLDEDRYNINACSINPADIPYDRENIPWQDERRGIYNKLVQRRAD